MVDNLIKRNIIIVNWCCMCRFSGKKIDHLLRYDC